MTLTLLNSPVVAGATGTDLVPEQPVAPTRAQVVEAIIREYTATGQRCSKARAGRVIALVKRVRDLRGRIYVLDQDDLHIATGPHDVMAVIMPDVEPGAQPHAINPGSAEDLLTRHVLQPGQRFVHSSDWEDGVRWCTVAVRVV